MNKEAAKKLIEGREGKHLTQQMMADKLATSLKQTYSLRQYQKLEEGKFPKYKKEIVASLDKLLGLNLYEQLYVQNVPREPLDNQSEVREQIHQIDYLKQRREQKNSSGPFLVPLVPVKAQAGYARSYDDIAFINQLEMYPILPGIDHRGQVWRYFEIQGDSMEPALFERDLVLVSMVSPEDWADLRNDQVYVIVTEKDVLIKIVHRQDKENWILASSNKRHKQRIIRVEDVREVWLFRRHISSKLSFQVKK
jgi:phage repressor protein C with HTH and peptisase S24 domain